MIKITNLSKIFNQGKSNELKALNKLNLTVEEGECLAITGKSGSGKTTLLNVLCGIERATTGCIEVDGVDITRLSDNNLAKYRSKNIGIVMQNFCLINECSALENVMLPLDFLGEKRVDKLRKSIALLKGVGLEYAIKKKVCELSGGEKQRVAIARALIADAKYILADEPTGALDTKTSKDIMDMLLRINSKGKTIIFVTHDPLVANRCTRIVEIIDSNI